MFYAIDNDKLTVESVSKLGEDLAAYTLDNELTLALTVVNEADDLSLNFTVEELTSFHSYLQGLDEFEDVKTANFDDEDDAAEACMELLEEHQSLFPKFTKTLGAKMLKAGAKTEPEGGSDKPTTKGKVTKERAPSKRITLDNDDTLVVVSGKCKKGSILDTIVNAINEEMLESVGEVLTYITENHIIPKTGELADMKFAEHNVKYFLKEGKISTEIV